MWTYNSTNGNLSRDGKLVATGYSGFGAAKNNPAMESHVNVGPVPRGRWTIDLESFDSETHGPVCMRLMPCHGTETFGRGGFMVHGDSIAHPGMASHGCIILPRPVRTAISQSGDSDLEVV